MYEFDKNYRYIDFCFCLHINVYWKHKRKTLAFYTVLITES